MYTNEKLDRHTTDTYKMEYEIVIENEFMP